MKVDLETTIRALSNGGIEFVIVCGIAAKGAAGRTKDMLARSELEALREPTQEH
jgi:predicted nucleotidyltransferase